ncbi:MAG: hypothetical protein LBC97_05555 [Bifidobacteriaceae bacterium]|jgi:hypothetical protein|nr:hypothetical protein [Bifidobacteriaceae bacterium]
MRALLDVNVVFGIWSTDLLMTAFAAYLYQVLWSEHTLAPTPERVSQRYGLAGQRSQAVHRRVQAMRYARAAPTHARSNG